jgi:hypothetical protein
LFSKETNEKIFQRYGNAKTEIEIRGKWESFGIQILLFNTERQRERGVRVAGVLYYTTRVMILVVQSGFSLLVKCPLRFHSSNVYKWATSNAKNYGKC